MFYGLKCPHCHSRTKVRSSREVTSTCRTMNLVCSDETCGATFGADITITHGISPSARPDPSVRLRQAPPYRRQDPPTAPKPANDTETRPTEEPANDEELRNTG